MANNQMEAAIKALETSITQGMRDGHIDIKDQMKTHYASKDYVWGMVWKMAAALCVLYMFITPMLYRAESTDLHKDMEHIINRLDALKENQKSRP